MACIPKKEEEWRFDGINLFSTPFIPCRNLGRLTWVRLQQLQEQLALPIPNTTVCAVFTFVQSKVWLPMFGIFNVCTDVNASVCTYGRMDTVRESALKVDSGRKVPCHTGESNLPQQCASLTLYQLSYIPVFLDTDQPAIAKFLTECNM